MHPAAMSTLTEKQREIVHSTWRPGSALNVVGGARCGKTTTLVNKIHHHIANNDIEPNEVLILSLTNKSIDNIISTGHGILADQLPWDQITLSTIHGLATKTVSDSQTPDHLLNIITEPHEWQTIRQLIPSSISKDNPRRRDKTSTTQSLEMMVRFYQNQLVTTKFGPRHLNPLDEKLVLDTLQVLKQCHVMTNDDLIKKAAECLQRDPSLLSQYKLIVIEDGQDLYPSLLPLLKQIIMNSDKQNVQLILFHDPNQRIYQFMGNNDLVIKELLSLHDKVTSISLSENLGTTVEIIQAANKVLTLNTATLSSSASSVRASSHLDPQVYNMTDPLKQLEFIVSEICKLMSTGVVNFNDIAILSRTNAFLTEIIEHLSKYGLPCEKLISRPEWINDLRIQFILNIFKIIRNGDRDLSMNCDFAIYNLLNQLKGIGNKSLQTLYHYSYDNQISVWKYFKNTTNVGDWDSSIANKSKIFNYLSIINQHIPRDINNVTIEELIHMINDIVMELDCSLFTYESHQSLEQFKTNFKGMVNVLSNCATSKPENIPLLDHFLRTYSLHDPIKTIQHQANTIKVSTVHSAKGITFPIVMIANPPPLNAQSTFPMDTNILYTAMTRARDLLYMINVNHFMVLPEMFTRHDNVALNQPFWNYYLQNDHTLPLKKTSSNKYSLSQVRSNQKFIQGKFGIRFLSTLPCKYSTLCKRLVR